MYCTKCGMQNDEGQNFCVGCGNALTTGQQPAQFPQGQPAKKPFYKRGWFIAIAIIVGIGLIGAIGSQGSSSSNTPDTTQNPGDAASQDGTASTASEPEEQKKDTYGVGDTFTYSKGGKDLYTLTINSVKLTSDRNQFSQKDPKQVVIINYTYENLAKGGELMVSDLNLKIIDADGNVCETYPAITAAYAKGTPAGAKCTAEVAYGLMSDNTGFKMMFYENVFSTKVDATFELTAE